MSVLRTKLFLLFVASLALFSGAHEELHKQPPWQKATQWPDRIVATIAEDPTTSFSVTWRTDMSVGVAVAEIAEAKPEARFDILAETVRGTTTHLELDHIAGPDGDIPIIQNHGLPAVHYHSVTFRDLKPDTLYAYRVRGTRGKWSPWRQLRTAPVDGPVQFVFFGDAQTGIRSHITRTFDAAAKAAPFARFAIHGGDLVNTAMYDKEWAEWFQAGGRTFVTIPSIPVPGNHDYYNFDKSEKLFISNRKVTSFWRPQFELPVVRELPEDLHETVYAIRYSKDLHIFALDSSGVFFDKQLAWLGKSLKASDATWKIATMHHPLFSFVGGTEHPATKDLRLQLLDTLEENDLDMMLTGHRHTYQRAESGRGVHRFEISDAHAVDTVFVVTASSTKRGDTKVEGWDRYSEDQGGDFSLERYGNKVPIFVVIDIDDGQLQYKAIDPLNNVYDAFRLEKDKAGKKTIHNEDPALGPIYRNETLGPYRAWDDLR